MPKLGLQNCLCEGAPTANLRRDSDTKKLIVLGELVRRRIIIVQPIPFDYNLAFSSHRDFTGTLIRLSRAIRGVGDPLVAAYTRCYLMRVGREKYVTDRSFMVENICDLLASYHQVRNVILCPSAFQLIDKADYLCSCTAPRFEPASPSIKRILPSIYRFTRRLSIGSSRRLVALANTRPWRPSGSSASLSLNRKRSAFRWLVIKKLYILFLHLQRLTLAVHANPIPCGFRAAQVFGIGRCHYTELIAR